MRPASFSVCNWNRLYGSNADLDGDTLVLFLRLFLCACRVCKRGQSLRIRVE